MTKNELEQKLKEYKEILLEISAWANPQAYKIHMLNKDKLLFHMEGIRKVLDEKFYKLD